MGGFRIKVIEVDCPIGIDGVRRLKYYANNNKLYWNSVSNASKYKCIILNPLLMGFGICLTVQLILIPTSRRILQVLFILS